MLLTMSKKNRETLEVLGGAAIALLILVYIAGLLLYWGGVAIDSIPRSFDAHCQNVEGGDVCQISY